MLNLLTIRGAAQALLAGVALACAACASMEGVPEEGEAVYVGEETEGLLEPEPSPGEENPSDAQVPEGEVPLAVAESEPLIESGAPILLDEITVTIQRHEEIRNLVSEARALLQDFELEYVLTGKGKNRKKNEVLRGRPVAFALWSESSEEWTIAQVEIPRPPVTWKPGGKPLRFTLHTPGIQAQHIKGTGAERLMFAFSKDGEPLKVYGRKFPVFDAALIKKKRWRAVVETAKPIVYLPFTRRHVRFQVRRWRPRVPAVHSAAGQRRVAPGQRALDRVPRRGAGRRRARIRHRHAGRDRANR